MIRLSNSLVIALLLLVGSTSCQKKTCADFKLGQFEAPDNQISDIKITRTATQQIERSESRNFKEVYDIIWINDCEYQLILKETTRPQNNFIHVQDTLKVSITAIEDDTYQYTAFLNGKQFVGDLKQTSAQID